MAEVKRLRTQVFNKPVGVVRADAGDDLPGRAIASAATSISNMAYREAAYRAEERGQEAALAEPSQNIVTLDPETGLPVAFGTASSYGSIAARSFENMVNRRFEESVNNELEERGREIAQQAGSAAAFRDRMSEYVSEMYSAGVNEAGEFNRYSRYIQETGTEYVASTYETLRQREVAAARAALARQQQIDGYRQLRGISHLITSGNFMEAATAIDAAYARNEDLLNSGSQTPAQWNRRYEELEALQQTIYQRETDARASRATTQLHRVYATASEEARAEINMAIANPDAMVNSQYHDLVVSALSGDVTPATLRTSLDVFGSSNDSIFESVGEQYFAQFSGQVSGDTTPQDIDAMIAGVSQTYQGSLSSDLLEHSFYLAVADLYGTEAPPEDVISFIQNAIQRPIGRNLDAVANAIGEGGRGIADRIASVTQSLSQEERDSLSQSFDSRRQLLNRITGAESRAEIDGIGASIRQTPADEFLVNHSGIVQQIEGSDLLTNEDRNSLLRQANRRFVAATQEVATSEFNENSDNYSPEVIRLAASGLRSFAEVAPDGFSQGVYDRLLSARRLEDTTVDEFLNDWAASLETARSRSIEELTFRQILNDAENGIPARGEDAQFLQDNLYPAGIPTTASAVLQDQTAMSLMGNHTMLPLVGSAIQNSLYASNEEEVRAALRLAQQAMNAGNVIPGVGAVQIDLLRPAVNDDTYSILSAASLLVSMDVDPIAAIYRLRDPEALASANSNIRGQWNVGSNQPLTAAFRGLNISPSLQEEMIAFARLQNANEQPIYSVDQMVDFFTERRNLSPDDSVVGRRIGESVEFSRFNYFTRDELASVTRDVHQVIVDSIDQGDALNRLLVGGTITDATITGIGDLLGVTPLRIYSQSIMEHIRGGSTESLEEFTLRERLANGMEAVGVEFLYQPIPSSFAGDDPTWIIGYQDANGQFAAFTVNGETLTLRPSLSTRDVSFASDEIPTTEPIMGAETRGELRRIAMQYAIAARNTDGYSREDRWLSTLRYTATLQHMTVDYFSSYLPENRNNYPSNMSDDEIMQLFTTFREQYESLPE